MAYPWVIQSVKDLFATKLSTSGGTMSGDLHFTAGGIRGVDCIELVPPTTGGHGGFLDFHYNGDSGDYTSRIIEDASGHIRIESPKGTLIDYALSVSGGIYSEFHNAPVGGIGAWLPNDADYSGSAIVYGDTSEAFGALIELRNAAERMVSNPGGLVFYTRYADGAMGPHLSLHRDGQAWWNDRSIATLKSGSILDFPVQLSDVAGYVFRSDDAYAFNLSADDTQTGVRGAVLRLMRTDSPSLPGGFFLCTRNADSTWGHTLHATQDGYLHWKGRRSTVWGYPSATYVDLPLGASGSTAIAPADGWVQLAALNASSLQLYNLTANDFWDATAAFNGHAIAVSVPVKAGEEFQYYYEMTSFRWLRFYYAEGML